MTSIRAALMLLWIAACGGDITGSTTNATRVVLDLRSLLRAQVPGDFASVVASATLTITSGGQQTNLTQALADNEPALTFNVAAVKTGTTDFRMEVISNDQTVLYRGTASARIENDGFTVPITLGAVGPVMVVSQRQPVADANNTAHIQIRNPGSDTLRWFADNTLSQNVVACTPRTNANASCLGPPGIALAADSSDSAAILFQFNPPLPRPTSQILVMGSNVGTATLNVTIPP
jgi:hypothetical protein